MKVLLNTDLGRVGRKGDIVEVAGGYARNYLLPKKMAVAATKGVEKQAELMLKSRSATDQREREAFESVASTISATQLQIVARAGAEGQLFGSVTTSEIAAELQRRHGREFDRRKIKLPDPIKSVGVHAFEVQLHSDVVARGEVNVVSDGAGDPGDPGDPAGSSEAAAGRPEGGAPAETASAKPKLSRQQKEKQRAAEQEEVNNKNPQ